MKLKKYEAKKEEYSKFIEFMVTFFSNAKEINSGSIDFTKEFQQDYYTLGATLAIYGSSKLYKEYCFFRRISTDEKVHESKYFDNYLLMLSFAKMFKIIRKEAGLNRDLISEPQILSFVLNDITKPELIKNHYRNAYNRIMIKFIIFGSNLKSTHWFFKIFYCFVKPLISIVLLSIGLLVLNIVIKPIKQLYKMGKGLFS